MHWGLWPLGAVLHGGRLDIAVVCCGVLGCEGCLLWQVWQLWGLLADSNLGADWHYAAALPAQCCHQSSSVHVCLPAHSRAGGTTHGAMQEKKKKKKRKSEGDDQAPQVEGAAPAAVPAEVAGTAAVINPGEDTPKPKKKKRKEAAEA